MSEGETGEGRGAEGGTEDEMGRELGRKSSLLNESLESEADSDAFELLSQSSVRGLSGGVGEYSVSSGDIGIDLLLDDPNARWAGPTGFVEDCGSEEARDNDEISSARVFAAFGSGAEEDREIFGA